MTPGSGNWGQGSFRLWKRSTVVLDVSLQGDGFFAKDAETGRLGSLGHIDAVFPVLHGTYGEDGTVQGLLSMMGVPFVGCGVLASAVCMDKHYTKVILEQAGIPVAPGITLDTRSYDAGSRFEQNGFDLLMQVEEAGLEYPLFVKPSRSGSSFGARPVPGNLLKRPMRLRGMTGGCLWSRG